MLLQRSLSPGETHREGQTLSFLGALSGLRVMLGTPTAISFQPEADGKASEQHT